MSWERSSACSPAAASSPWRPCPPSDLASWAISGRPRSSAASRGEVGGVAGDHGVAVAGGPAAGGDRERNRPGGELGGRALGGVDLDRLLDHAAGDRLLPLVVEALDHGPELELVRRLAQLRAVGYRAQRLGDVDRHLDVVDHRRQALRDPRVLGVLGEVLLALRARDLLDRLEHPIERAELLQELGRGLVADPGHAGDVVRGVALEPDEVGDQLRRHPVALDHPLGVVDLGVGDPARGGHHPDSVANELVDVAIAGDDHHRDLGLARAASQGRDHIVGLEPLDLDVAKAKRLGERRQVRPLLLEQVGPRLTLRLVVGEDPLAPGPALVPGDDHRLRRVVDQDLGHHRSEPVDRVRRPPVRGRDRLRQREEGAIGEAVPVDQEQLLSGPGIVGLRHASIVFGRSAAGFSPRYAFPVPGPANVDLDADRDHGAPGRPLARA